MLIGVVATLAMMLSHTPASTAASTAASTDVVPIDFNRFRSGKPADADSERLEEYLLGACKYSMTEWYNTTADYDAQTSQYLTLQETVEGARVDGGHASGCATALALGIYNDHVTGIPEATVRSRTVKIVASLAKVHKANGGSFWGYNNNPKANEVAMFGMSGWLLWNDFTPADQQMIHKVMEGEANSRISYTVPYYRNAAGTVVNPGDSHAEAIGRMGEVFGLATGMMPNHPNRNAWETKGIEMWLGGFARP